MSGVEESRVNFMRFANDCILFLWPWTDQSKRPVPHISERHRSQKEVFVLFSLLIDQLKQIIRAININNE